MQIAAAMVTALGVGLAALARQYSWRH